MRIVVLFNLKDGVSADDYEAWARGTDMPGVRALGSVRDFQVYRTAGTLGGGVAPYDYIEVIDITGMDAFMADVGSEAVQKVAAEFGRFTDDPQFILTEAL
jgi:hypothetical protein